MVHYLHNTILDIENVNIHQLKEELCSREDLLNKHEVKLIENKIKNQEDLLFMGNDISENFPSNRYQLIIYGILPCGSKTVLEINGIEPYIDIQGDKLLSQHENIVKTRSILMSENLEYSTLKINKGKPFILYNEEESDFIRIYFKSLKNRKDAMKYFQHKKITTYNNDISCYYRVVARDYQLNLTSWNIISNYKVIFNSYLYKSKYHIKINFNDIKPYENEDYKNFTDIPKQLLQLDKSISMCFDIEAYKPILDNGLNCGKTDEEVLFMLCMTYQFINSKDYGLNVCLVTNSCEPQEDLFTIVCHNESNLIKVFAIFNEFMQPDFITEFNGSDFDWPFLMNRADMFNLILYLTEHMSIKKLTEYDLNKDQIMKWKYKEERVKAEADRYVISRNLNLQGYLPFDTRIVFKQLYPTESKSSLNHYLMLNNLGSKDDMPINELFRIYESGTAAEMKLVAHYCFIDSWKLHLLNIKKNVIQDKREVCKLSYTSMFDGFYRAGGLKVRNLIISKAISRNLYINNHRPFEEDEEGEKGKYPGALVLNPKKGLLVPIYNIYEFNDKEDEKISNEKLQRIQEYINNNYEKIYIEKKVDYDNLASDLHNFVRSYVIYLRQNEFQYPISGLDFSSLYPSLIMAYNLSPEFLINDENYATQLKNRGVDIHPIKFNFGELPIRAWTVRHDESQENSNFGLYPSILKFLFNERKNMKKDLFKYKEQKEHFETTEDYLNNSEYHDCVFNLSYVDSKQKALKVFMNTFYGELGNQRSPLFTLPLAGGVTSSGQDNLRMVYDHVVKRKCKVYYGDSVRGDTPILIKQNNIIKLLPIEEIGWDDYNINYDNEKEIIYDTSFDVDDNSFNKIEVYSENGWTPIKKMIRHYTTKELFRVSTHTGSIVVTEDHSLLTKDGNEITPSNCKIGTELLHWDNIQLKEYDFDEKIAFVYGFFFGDGSCGYYECPNGKKYTFALNNSNLDYLKKCVDIFNNYYDDVKLQIYDTLKSSGVYKANATGNVKNIVLQYRKMFYSNRGIKKVPNIILNSNDETKNAFIKGYYLANGDKDKKNCNRMDYKGQLGSQGLFILLHSLGYNVSINTRSDKLEIYRLTFTKNNKQRQNPISIKKIDSIGQIAGYVYDFETESHHFAAGIGKLVVHNTDSLYITCPEQCFLSINKKYYTQKINKEEYCTKLVEKTFKAIDIIKDEVNELLFNDNKTPYLKMAYEEVLFPVAFLAKKKYYGIPHEGMVNFQPKDLFIRGLEVKKRGVSELLRKVCLDIMWESCSLANIYNIRELVEKKIHYVFSNKWDINDFIQTAVWKPEKQNITVNTFVERMQKIGGRIPEPYERFKYVVIKKYPYTYDIKGRQRELKKGEKIEYLETAIENDLEIDLTYYFEGELTGQFARLISYDKDFEEFDEENNIDDDKTFKNCQKHILELANIYNSKFINRGKIFKDIYRNVNKKINNKKIYNNKMDFVVNLGSNLPEFNFEHVLMENMKNHANTLYNYDNTANKIIDNYKKKYTEKKYLNQLHNLYCESKNSYYSKINKEIDMEIINNRQELMKLLMSDNLYQTIFDINNINIEKIINYIKEKYQLEQLCITNDSNISSLTDICDEDELAEIINDKDLYHDVNMDLVYQIYNLITKIISLYSKKILNETIFNITHRKICATKNNIDPPSSFNKNEFIYGNY